MSQDQYPTIGHLRGDLDSALEDIIPANMSDKRYKDIMHAVLDWAEEIAYEHGEERFACGEEAGEDKGYERGWEEGREELDRTYTNRSPMAQGFAHRFRERGWDVAVYDGTRDDLALEVSEQDAMRLLAG